MLTQLFRHLTYVFFLNIEASNISLDKISTLTEAKITDEILKKVVVSRENVAKVNANPGRLNIIISLRKTFKSSARRICCANRRHVNIEGDMFLPVKSSSSPVNTESVLVEMTTSSTTAEKSCHNSTQTPSDLSPVGGLSDDVLPQAHHQNPGHCIASFSAINRMRQNVQLCDVTLSVGDEMINCHKVILASVSPYFFAMFNEDMLERNMDVISLHDIDPDSLKRLIDYAYTGEITITEENVQVLLPASSLLQIQSVREACCKFLLRQLHPSNCLGIRSFADAHSCKELHSRSHRFALQNFQQVVGTEEFLLLGFNEVQDLISNTQLNISSEEKVFTAVLNWVKNDLNERQKFVSELMTHVRLPLVSREFLMECVESEALVREDPQCKELLLEAMKYHLLPEHRSTLITQRTLERRPEGMKPYIFAVGGGSLFAIHNECEAYNSKTNTWLPIAPMLTRRSRAGATSLRKLLYVVGGYDGENDLSSAERYNPMTNEWQMITPMGTKRSCLGICAFDGLLYVCGGYDGASCLASVERYG